MKAWSGPHEGISTVSRLVVVGGLIVATACTGTSEPSLTTGNSPDPTTTTSFVATTEASAAEIDEHTAYVQEALEIIEKEFFKTEEVDWDPIREWAFNIVEDNPTTEGAHEAVEFALAALDTPHTGFMRPGATRDGQVTRRPPPSGERLDGDVGYLDLPGITDLEQAPEYAGQLRQTMEELDGSDPVCGWIFDFRESIGGSSIGDWLGLGPLVDDDLLMHFGRADGARQSVYYEDGVIRREEGDENAESSAQVPADAYVPDRLDVPIAVLISSRTDSAGEAAAITFVGRPHTRFFGEKTSGSTISSEFYEMPDGAGLRIPSGYYQDRTGREYEGGLEPDTNIEIIGDTDDHVLNAAREWLSTQQSCDT